MPGIILPDKITIIQEIIDLNKESKNSGDYRHKEHPKKCATDDFWGQVSRTINGVPVSQENIDIIVNAIRDGLSFSSDDALLDIGCGNGALSQYFFDEVAYFHGIDFSEYLIKIAKSNFEKKPTHVFTEKDAVEYVETETDTDKYTKVLCYGAFTYFSFENAERLLSAIANRFTNVDRIFIGNLPDKDRAHLFYHAGKDYSNLLEDRESPIGIWRSKDEFSRLANKTGWDVEFFVMPEDFYSAHYRYDALLRRHKNKD